MNIDGYDREIDRPDNVCLGIFGDGCSGKTHLCATATEWAEARGQVPGWVINDFKARKTIKQYHDENGLKLPYINKNEFITSQQALELATNTDLLKVQKVYTEVIDKLLHAVVSIGAVDEVNPIIMDSGTLTWNWMAFSHFGRKQSVGKSREWGPPKMDWSDMMTGILHKTVLITFRSKDQWKNDKSTGRLTWDGPPHLINNTTSIVRCNFDANKQTDYVWDKFSLDVVESQDNVGLAGVNGVLEGQSITLTNLMNVLRPGE